MRDAAIRRFRLVELFGLYGVAFFLPTMESPKWIVTTLFFLGLLGRRIAENRIGWRKPDRFEYLLISMWIISLASTIVNWPLPNGISGLKDTSLYLAIGWIMYINNYRESQIKFLLFALIGGVMLGLGWGLWDFFTGHNPYLEFKSIPNLNRSAIYHTISIFLMLAVMLGNNYIFTIRSRVAVTGCFLISLACLIIMGSRGSILGFLAGAILLVIMLYKNRRLWITMAIGLIFTAAVIIITVVILDITLVSKKVEKFTHYYHSLRHHDKLESFITPSELDRYDYIRVAWAQITQGGHMLLGTGPETFQYINVDQLKFDKPLMAYNSQWFNPSHAHNEFLTRWVEEGLLGLIVHIIFLGFVARSLFYQRPKDGKAHWAWIACAGFLSVAVVSGLFNSVLTNEMGWLSMMIVGIYMRQVKKNGLHVLEPASIRPPDLFDA
jgi:O-antigen ligase